MAANHTTNYELNQWLSTDQVLRTDFNADNAKLDVALAGKAEQTDLSEVQTSIPRVAAGTYTGDGAASRTIHIGFSPKAALVFHQMGCTYLLGSSSTPRYYGGLAVAGGPVPGMADLPVVSLQEDGFQVAYSDERHVLSNQEGSVYHYLALG